MKSSKIRGYLLIALSAVILGSNVIYARSLDLPSPILNFFRYFFGSFILLIYIVIRDKKLILPKTQKKEIVALGIINTLLSLTAFYAFMNTSIANAEILLYSYPVYILFLAPLILKEKIEKSTIPALILSFLGLILIAVSGNIFSGSQNFAGLLSGFVSGIIFALYVLIAKIIRNQHDGLLMNFYQLAITVIILFPFMLFLPYQIDIKKIIILVIMGLVNSTLALSFYFQGLRLVKAQHVGIISYLEPLSAVFYAAILFKEIPGLLTVLGGVFILYGGYRLVKVKK